MLPLAAIGIFAGVAYYCVGAHGISLESLVSHRTAIDAFVIEHRLLAVLSYIALYVIVVALSLPGAAFLTLAGGFLFGVALGASASVVGATFGATCIFLVARTAVGESLLRWAGPRAQQLAKGFRDDAFSYLLFLRLVPAFPFFVINLAMGLTPMRAFTFYWVSQIGMLPATIVYVYAGTQLGEFKLSWQLLLALALIGIFPLAAKRALHMIKSRRTYARMD